MEVPGAGSDRADRQWTLYESVALGAAVALVALSLPMVNVFGPFLGGAVAGMLWNGSQFEGLIVGAFTGLVLVVPAAGVSVLVDLVGVSVSSLVQGSEPLLNLVIVAPSGLVAYRVSAYALLVFGVLFGLSGGILGGSAREALA